MPKLLTNGNVEYELVAASVMAVSVPACDKDAVVTAPFIVELPPEPCEISDRAVAEVDESVEHVVHPF